MTILKSIRQRAESDALRSGCYLNPNFQLLEDLLKGLKRNVERYGYNSCPCRLASGIFEYDRDILCPCDYRDQDIVEHGACYCNLYLRKDVFEGETPLPQVSERRPLEKQERAYQGTVPIQQKEKVKSSSTIIKDSLGIILNFWYCKQCGYICYREEPPYQCPICKAKRDLFAKINKN